MREYLKHYKMRLTVLSPIFIGSGNEILKKEYLFLNGRRHIGVLDTVSLYLEMKKRGREKEFETFLLKSNDDLSKWVLDNRRIITLQEVEQYLKYKLFISLDTPLEKGIKPQILECMKDPYGFAYIPGSSIKGMLRTVLLGADILKHSQRFDALKKRLQKRLQNSLHFFGRRKDYLKEEISKIEQLEFHTLNRLNKDKDKDNAVNDSLSGFIVSDSSSVGMEKIILCRKIDRNVDGDENKLPILRECVVPGTSLDFTITIDESLCKITIDDVLKAVDVFSDNYYDRFVSAFQGFDRYQSGTVFLGGGTGFANKTVIYNLFHQKDAVLSTQTILKYTIGKKYNEHKHQDDLKKYKISPHTLKCTHYEGRTVQMGMCRLDKRD